MLYDALSVGFLQEEVAAIKRELREARASRTSPRRERGAGSGTLSQQPRFRRPRQTRELPSCRSRSSSASFDVYPRSKLKKPKLFCTARTDSTTRCPPATRWLRRMPTTPRITVAASTGGNCSSGTRLFAWAYQLAAVTAVLASAFAAGGPAHGRRRLGLQGRDRSDAPSACIPWCKIGAVGLRHDRAQDPLSTNFVSLSKA